MLGFGARAMRDDQGPKYLNTSENDLYHKGRQLFGLDLAREEAMRKAGRFVVVEGYTDVLALHQAGIRGGRGDHGHGAHRGAARRAGEGGRRHRVGSSTSLSTPIEPGQEADVARRAARGGSRYRLRVVEMPEGTDPAEL